MQDSFMCGVACSMAVNVVLIFGTSWLFMYLFDRMDKRNDDSETLRRRVRDLEDELEIYEEENDCEYESNKVREN